MIEGMMLAWYSSGGTIGNLLARWEQAGVFSYLLPFLLIFALVFGILTRVKLFEENKAVNSIISLAVALMSLQFGFVSVFFSEIFPQFGMGLAILLIAMILLMVAFGEKSEGTVTWIIFGLGAIIFIVVLINTFGSVGWVSGYWFADRWLDIILVAIGLALVFSVIFGGGKKKKNKIVVNPD